jgi:L-threonylcarbamoyladenylate synthase
MNFENDIKNCIALLKRGGIILYPTDTIWGLGCDASNEKAVAKIYSIKKRDEKKSMIILLADEKEIKNHALTPTEPVKKLMNESLSPLTIIYPEAKNLAANLINEDGTIAIRIVKDDFCEQLIAAFGKPIVSTSANISGEPSPQNFSTISSIIKKNADYIVIHRQQEKEIVPPSKIVKWLGSKEFIVIRN